MKKFFEKFLLGILWLLAVTLAITFWMNVQYGFDMLSAAHWEYLGTLQAHRSQIKPGFYISIIAALCIALVGLYFIVRPRPRNIRIPATPAPAPTPVPTKPTTVPNIPAPQPVAQPKNVEPQPTYTPRPAPAISVSARPMSPSGLHSPLSRPTATPTAPVPNPTTVPIIPTIQNTPKPKMDPEIQTILESSGGYIVKTCEKIGKLRNTLVAIAYNQTIRIVATDVKPEEMVDAIQTLITIFDDTLGSTANDITLRGLILNPTEPNKREDDLITTFNNKDEFTKYVSEHKNNKPDDYDAELFDAFSTYINTVIGYVGKA